MSRPGKDKGGGVGVDGRGSGKKRDLTPAEVNRLKRLGYSLQWAYEFDATYDVMFDLIELEEEERTEQNRAQMSRIANASLTSVVAREARFSRSTAPSRPQLSYEHIRVIRPLRTAATQETATAEPQGKAKGKENVKVKKNAGRSVVQEAQGMLEPSTGRHHLLPLAYPPLPPPWQPTQDRSTCADRAKRDPVPPAPVVTLPQGPPQPKTKAPSQSRSKQPVQSRSRLTLAPGIDHAPRGGNSQRGGRGDGSQSARFTLSSSRLRDVAREAEELQRPVMRSAVEQHVDLPDEFLMAHGVRYPSGTLFELNRPRYRELERMFDAAYNAASDPFKPSAPFDRDDEVEEDS